MFRMSFRLRVNRTCSRNLLTIFFNFLPTTVETARYVTRRALCQEKTT